MSIGHIYSQEIERLKKENAKLRVENCRIYEELARIHQSGISMGDDAKVTVEIQYCGRSARGYGTISGLLLRNICEGERAAAMERVLWEVFVDAAKWLNGTGRS